MPLKLTNKERLIVDLMQSKDEMYGAEMVRVSNGSLKRGTVYVYLARLEDRQYVTSRLEERHPKAIGLPRRLYKLTDWTRKQLSYELEEFEQAILFYA
ncbi:MAG: helix-turn-helix transcriptional regulator [Candidatus Liptonbacteria bacterium]|nr:helix-turn-helix transcriptional regulator [Candidatus Liptonbacteria bacterium]